MRPIAERDPLGLSDEQRAFSDASNRAQELYADRVCGYCRRYGHAVNNCPTATDFRAAGDQLMEMMRENLAAIDALPGDTMVQCHLPGCGPHPIEMYR